MFLILVRCFEADFYLLVLTNIAVKAKKPLGVALMIAVRFVTLTSG